MKTWVVAVIVILILILAGAVYYFFVYKPNAYAKKFAQLEPDTQKAFITWVNAKGGYTFTATDKSTNTPEFRKALVKYYDQFEKMGNQIGDQISQIVLPF